jgi:regulator of protease activity HflC (stomatin/prohibitin superfamily)
VLLALVRSKIYGREPMAKKEKDDDKEDKEDEVEEEIKKKLDLSFEDEEPKSPMKLIVLLVVGFILLIVVLAILSATVINVPAGHKGVIVAGFDVGYQFNEGWNMKNPFSTVDMVRYNTQIEKEMISARSADGYNVNIDFAVRYHLAENSVAKVRVDNPDYKETVIRSTLRSEARLVVSDWNLTGEQMNQQRTAYENEVEIRVKDRLDDYYIIVEDVMLRNLDFPATVNDAWERRAAAQVDVATAGYELEAERLRAQKELVRALAEANSTIALAEGQAEAIKILANETVEINETVMNYILSLRYISALRDPETKVDFVVIPIDQPLILQLPENP